MLHGCDTYAQCVIVKCFGIATPRICRYFDIENVKL